MVDGIEHTLVLCDEVIKVLRREVTERFFKLRILILEIESFFPPLLIKLNLFLQVIVRDFSMSILPARTRAA